jgi:LDH2 family malate/lactate/ureidoglycolate dehydrogenase
MSYGNILFDGYFWAETAQKYPSNNIRVGWAGQLQFLIPCKRSNKLMNNEIIVNADKLKDFCYEVFLKIGVNREDSQIIADNLVCADLRGIPSHGVARLGRYVKGIQQKTMITNPDVKIIKETPVSAVIDACAGLGAPVSFRAMKRAIEKAKTYGVGFISVRNSNHYGIAGYYSMMALEHDMIGISMTNSDQLVVPTFGKQAILGTNPISVAIPAAKEKPYVLDMATSVIPRGKIEVYDRQEKDLLPGWTVDERGLTAINPGTILKNLTDKIGGGILPLGGDGEEHSGHKGYGLAFMVDIFSGVLSGSGFGNLTYPVNTDGSDKPSNIGHFFGAISIDAFRDVDEFKSDMDKFIRILKNSPKADNQDRIYIHGEKEFEKMEKYLEEGIPLTSKVASSIEAIGKEIGVPFFGGCHCEESSTKQSSFKL